MINKTLYNTIALGGTFDHLHDGHKDFLLFSSEISKSLIIGVTNQSMTLSKPYAQLIQPAYQRKQAVSMFCKQNNINAKIVTLDDPFGPTIEDNNIEAIACTTQTVAGANKINEIRSKLRLKELPIHIHQLKKDAQNLGVISAERIRAGEIDRQGNVYEAIFKNDLQLTSNMRQFFTKLHGQIITIPTQSSNQNTLRIVVGDSVLETFIENNWEYDLGVFDNKKQRQIVESPLLKSLNEIEKIKNIPGTIETQTVKAFQNWLNNKKFKHIMIDGEEDLVAVIAILLSPLNTFVYYGQPNVGMVECLVTENLKNSFYEILKNKNSI